MALQVKNLTTDRRTITALETDAGEVTFTYKPSIYTAEIEDTTAEFTKDQRAANGVAYLLAEMLVDWDVEDEGAPFPPTLENLKKVPVAFLGDILTAIGEDIRPKEAKSPKSRGG